MIGRYVLLVVLSLSWAAAFAFADDWLGGGYVGSPDYGEIRQYFTDPIFYTKVPVSQPLSFYNPYYTSHYKQPLYLGRYTNPNVQSGFPFAMNPNPYYFWQSDFRNRSLAGMQWEPFRKNWTNTTVYASRKSSFRVMDKGTWKIM